MELPGPETFHLRNPDQLRAELARLRLDLPVDDDSGPLAEPLEIAGRLLPNRLCVQPLEGCDARPDGSPGRLTVRRYTRYAQGGWGLIWLEATAVAGDARSRPAQLWIHERNVASYAELVAALRGAARDRWGRDVLVLVQLTHAGRYGTLDGAPRPLIVHHSPALDRLHNVSAEHPLATDDALDRLQEQYLAAARLAARAGFDGVDVKSCHHDLIAELLAAFTRSGKYGGAFENRTRFLRETVRRIRECVPDLLVTTRMSAFDAVPHPHGFGVDRSDHRVPDPAEPIQLAAALRDQGLAMLNVAVDSPRVAEGTGGSDDGAGPGPDEHPLAVLARSVAVTRAVQRACPALPVVGGDYTWLRQFLPHVAAGVVRTGGAAIIGIGRGALAYPDAAGDILRTGRLDPLKCCIACSACTQLMRNGGRVGCVIRDSAIYGAEYRGRRRFSLPCLKEEARRCRGCEAAPCTAACPTRIDVPAFIQAFAEDDIAAAFAVIRRANVLPEMCSHLCPAWLQCEGSCIETALTGTPIRIRDLQYVVCWRARLEGLTGARIPDTRSGRRVAVVGAGPAGVAGAIRLLEQGHDVVLFERDRQLGGVPQTLIPATRCADVQAEIEAILQPAREAGRLQVRMGQALGRDVALADLTRRHDAVLLAPGLWRERSLGRAEGVVDAVTFLRRVRSREIASVPETVAVLAGGDCAMDAARSAQELGAGQLYVVYEGPLSTMHWHMSDAWFRTAGVHSLALTRPLGYEVDARGRLAGLRICRTRCGPPDGSGTRPLVPVPGSEHVLAAGMVIEAMGLGVSEALRQALDGLPFTAGGLLATASADSFATGRERVFAAGALINGGASVAQCVAEGMRAAEEIDRVLNAPAE